MERAMPARRLGGIHHVAYRCLDAEQTRWFYEDVLGLTAVAALIIDDVPGSGEHRPYLHLFFEVGRGEYLAFFDSPEDAAPDAFGRKASFDMHIAIEGFSEDDMLAMQARVRSLGIKCAGPIDHGFVRSVYMYDPNGIQVEITVKTPQHDAILEAEGARLTEQLAAWSTRTHAIKAERFGQAALDRRASAPPKPG